MKTSNQNVQMRQSERVREYSVEKTALFGIFRWREVEKVDSLGTRLDIFAEKEPKEIYLNGRLLS